MDIPTEPNVDRTSLPCLCWTRALWRTLTELPVAGRRRASSQPSGEPSSSQPSESASASDCPHTTLVRPLWQSSCWQPPFSFSVASLASGSVAEKGPLRGPSGLALVLVEERADPALEPAETLVEVRESRPAASVLSHGLGRCRQEDAFPVAPKVFFRLRRRRDGHRRSDRPASASTAHPR